MALVFGATQGAAAEAEVLVPPLGVVDPAAPEVPADPASPTEAEGGGTAVNSGSPAEPATVERETGGSEAGAPDESAGRTEPQGTDPETETADTASPTPANAQTPTATAEKTKKVTSAAFTKQVHEAAMKKAGWHSSESGGWGGDFKATKSQRWWVRVDGKHYTLKNDPGQSTVTTYRKAVMSKFKSAGMKQRGTATASNQVSRTYSNTRLACTVRYTVPSQYGVSAGASLSCTTVSKVKQAVKKTKPFAKAYQAKQKGSLKRISLLNPTVKKSASKKFASYKKATVGIVPVLGVGGFGGYFAKAPKKSWRYVLGAQAIQECRSFESSTTARRAWAGEACMRGTWPNSYQSKVRAK
ncbi:MAG: hypothetical protein ACK5LO_14690 [Leucobacter sp.]